MFTNLYHIAAFRPSLEREGMTIGREELAQRLVKSGQLRIDAGEKINFARLYVPDLNISMMFSYRELYDENLSKNTTALIKKEMSSHYKGSILDKKAERHISLLKDELKKYQEVRFDEEIQLARLIVQATHPVVMMLILEESVQVFISHSYNIGDVLDIISWQTSGSNSGMQSTNGKDVAIFISCGGNPLKDNEDKFAEHGDGWPARARLLAIGGQEFGHYSDIIRDEKGKQISRYSANFNATKANEDVRVDRLNDIKRSSFILNKLNEIGLESIIETEKKIKFYKDNKKIGLSLSIEILKLFFQKLFFFQRAEKNNIFVLDHIKSEPRIGTLIKAIAEDMLFNLSPKADVYKKDNKDEEEAIACVEALARVPQQANKWGKPLTQIFMKDLYVTYYKTVIPGCVVAYQNITKKRYEYNSERIRPSFVSYIKNLFAKTLYYPKYKSNLLK